MTIPTDDDLLGIFWEESYPGGSDSPIAEEPKWVYTDHEHGIAAVRKAIIEGLAQEAEELPTLHDSPFRYEDNGIRDMNDEVADWLRSHL